MTIRRIRVASGFLSMFFLIISAFLSFNVVMFSAAEVHSATRYVKPRGEAVVRRGQGTNFKIVSMVKDGDSVELIEENKSYSLIKLSNGTQGWILKRFLTSNPPLTDVVASLRKEKDELLQREITATEKVEEISTILSRTKADLDDLVEERDRIVADFQKLQRDTADVVRIKNDLDRTLTENISLTEKLSTIEQENSALKKDKTINWFMAGAGALLIGVLLGRMPSPSRKRKSSLLS